MSPSVAGKPSPAPRVRQYAHERTTVERAADSRRRRVTLSSRGRTPWSISHLARVDGTAAGLDAGPMKIGYSAQATASVELFMDYMDEAGVDRAVFVQPWFYHWDNRYMVSCLRRFPSASAACA